MQRSGWLAVLWVIVSGVGTGAAQEQAPVAGETSLEAAAGWAGFVDESRLDHGVLGGAARIRLTPYVSLGPEVTWMAGPGSDRDLFVTGNVWVDLVQADHASRRPVPFLVAGAGWMRHSMEFLSGRYSHVEGTFTAGGGVRFPISSRWDVAADVRLGWETHLRVTAALGYRLGR